MKIKKKPIIFYLHSEYCLYCAMENKIIKNLKINTLLNQKYYFISLDEKEENDLYFNGKLYQGSKKDLSVPLKHEFVQYFSNLRKVTSYPLFIFFSEDYEIISIYPGFLNKEKLVNLIK